MARPNAADIQERLLNAEPVEPNELVGVQWLPRDDPLGKGIIRRPNSGIMAITVIAGPGQHKEQRRGTVSAEACRWFYRKGAERVLFRMSANGEYCLLESDIRGVKLVNRKRSVNGVRTNGGWACSVSLPPDLPIGAIIELTDFNDHLVGRMPKKEDNNGNY